ncbi:hypothetical protein SSAG_02464 [Streptomyces sp. Mg1]|nr:hypothetical protein SSAG_02464 [Streptomyces sp. Mg1]
MTCSVCGETTRIVPVPSGSVHSPPMNSCPCSTSSVMADASCGRCGYPITLTVFQN